MGVSGGAGQAGRPSVPRRLSAALVAVIAAVAVGVSAGQALADVIAEKGILANYGNGMCVQGRSEISDGQYLMGYIKTDVVNLGDLWGMTGSCNWAESKPPNYLKIKHQLSKFNGVTGGWDACWTSNVLYNSTTASELKQGVTFSGSRPYCGNGWYQNLGRSYVLDNNTWYGGALWSGYHYLPA